MDMRKTFRMNEFDAFNVYLAFKLHFTTDKYDITKTRGAIKTKEETFYKRSDQFNFKKLAQEFSQDELPRFLIANHVDGNRWGGAFIYEEALKVYNNWRGRLQSLTKNFKNDLDKICSELDEDKIKKFDKCFVVKDEQHPLLLQMYSRGDVTIETMLILDSINNYLSYWDKTLKDDFFWKEERRKLIKYRPFLDFDVDKYKVIMYSRTNKYDETGV
jgi:hypothetical protein